MKKDEYSLQLSVARITPVSIICLKGSWALRLELLKFLLLMTYFIILGASLTFQVNGLNEDAFNLLPS